MLKNLNHNYSGKLKEALVARSQGTLTPSMETTLGNCIYSVARWVMGTQVSRGELSHEMGDDEDLCSHVMVKLLEAIDKVDLTMAPEQIITYLFNAGKLNGVKHFIRDANCAKRKHDDVELADATLEVDFYGNICLASDTAQAAFN